MYFYYNNFAIEALFKIFYIENIFILRCLVAYLKIHLQVPISRLKKKKTPKFARTLVEIYKFCV